MAGRRARAAASVIVRRSLKKSVSFITTRPSASSRARAGKALSIWSTVAALAKMRRVPERTTDCFRGRMQSVVRSGTRLIFANAATVDQIESAFPARAREDADGLVVMNDTLFFNERRTITEAAARARRPAIYPLRAFV